MATEIPMIDRIIQGLDKTDPRFAKYPRPDKQQLVNTIVQTLRDPTKEMIRAAWDSPANEIDCWQAMVDAIRDGK